ncbi:MAG: hypothetical protein H7Y60_13500 [Rhodospirillaceae bacterium]|nr:hypothetical protein [Rhodospirillales bacterium]
MKIAIHHSFPGKAEAESAERMAVAAGRLGWAAKVVVHKADISLFDPDFVLCLSHHEGKTTSYPTYGVIMAPLPWYAQSREAIARILGYDGYLTVSSSLRNWLTDLNLAFCGQPPQTAHFTNTIYSTESSGPLPPAPLLAYVGTNWDGWRSYDLFRALARRGDVRFFGPPESWTHVESAAYGGAVPFDGHSVLEIYRRCGTGLGLDRLDFTADDLPTNRIFEVAAAGALGIMGDVPFIRRHFGDTVLRLDSTAPPSAIAWQIDRHLAWIRANPGEAAERAAAAHAIFNRDFSLERLLPNVAELHDRCRGEPAKDLTATPAFCERWLSASPVSSTCRLDVRLDYGDRLAESRIATGRLPAGRDGMIEAYVAPDWSGTFVLGNDHGDIARVEVTPKSGDCLWRVGIAFDAGMGDDLNVDWRLASAAPVALTLRLVCDCPIHDIAQMTGRIWIFGAREGGRRVAAALAGNRRADLVGFMDDFQDGTLDGHPVRPLAAWVPELQAGDTVIIATQHWLELWRRLRDLVPLRIYTAHPGYGRELALLTP